MSRVATRLIEGVYRGSAHTEYPLLAGGDQVREQCRELITRPTPAAQFRKKRDTGFAEKSTESLLRKIRILVCDHL